MGFFKKETIILKESTSYRDYLSKLEKLYETALVALRFELEKEIKITRAGIAGEDNILYIEDLNYAHGFLLWDIDRKSNPLL